jgi:hypothetical protein
MSLDPSFPWLPWPREGIINTERLQKMWRISVPYEFVNSQEISLGERVLDLKDLGEIVDGAMSTFQRKTSLVLETPCGIDANRNALTLVLALGHGLNIFKVTNCPG